MAVQNQQRIISKGVKKFQEKKMRLICLQKKKSTTNPLQFQPMGSIFFGETRGWNFPGTPEVPPNGSRSVSTRRLHLHFQRHLRMHQSPVPMDLHVRGRENLTPKITRERKITWEQPMGFSQVGFREGTAI